MTPEALYYPVTEEDVTRKLHQSKGCLTCYFASKLSKNLQWVTCSHPYGAGKYRTMRYCDLWSEQECERG